MRQAESLNTALYPSLYMVVASSSFADIIIRHLKATAARIGKVFLKIVSYAESAKTVA